MEYIKNVSELYVNEKLPLLFKGGFINFGFWGETSLVKDKLVDEDMIIANSQLYYAVFKKLNLNDTDRVLEVGSGHGAGGLLLHKAYDVQSVTCLDYIRSHIDLSIRKSKKLSTLQYIQGRAEELPFSKNSFDKIYTLEAFQHFNVWDSIAEFQKVLVKNGSLVICTFFAKNKKNFSDILQLLPRTTILSDNDDETNAALPDFLKILRIHGFSKITVEAIGNKVWYGFDKWVSQNEKAEWNRNWLIAYRKNLLDYYLITAELHKK